MEATAIRTRASMCSACWRTRRNHLLRYIASLQTPLHVTPTFRVCRDDVRTPGSPPLDAMILRRGLSARPMRLAEVDMNIREAQQATQQILRSGSIPKEQEILGALDSIDSAATVLAESNGLKRQRPNEDDNATSAILRLDRAHAREQPLESAAVKKTTDDLSALAYSILTHPPTFLTPEILKRYIQLQTALLRTETFPEIFRLYATKPSPSNAKGTGQTISYSRPSSDAIAAAIDPKVVDIALNAAVRARNLDLTLSIVESTICTKAFHRAKVFQRALPPMVAAGLMPLAAYTIASGLATQQTGLDPADFTQIAFAGIFTYTACVGTIGYVALTTANDQMQRVTWAMGMPLWERWLREEERAAADRIALAWGFQQRSRWGDEEGDEWDKIRDWCGLRGMVLDKVGLMEGMA